MVQAQHSHTKCEDIRTFGFQIAPRQIFSSNAGNNKNSFCTETKVHGRQNCHMDISSEIWEMEFWGGRNLQPQNHCCRGQFMKVMDVSKTWRAKWSLESTFCLGQDRSLLTTGRNSVVRVADRLMERGRRHCCHRWRQRSSLHQTYLYLKLKINGKNSEEVRKHRSSFATENSRLTAFVFLWMAAMARVAVCTLLCIVSPSVVLNTNKPSPDGLNLQQANEPLPGKCSEPSSHWGKELSTELKFVLVQHSRVGTTGTFFTHFFKMDKGQTFQPQRWILCCPVRIFWASLEAKWTGTSKVPQC